MNIRIGTGFDVHAFTAGRPLIIGGVTIPFDRGLAGHSDADVLVHAIIDALLGSTGLGDIGKLFPDTDAKYKNADSIKLLENVFQLFTARGWEIINIDTVVICTEPKMAPHVGAMKKTLSRAMGNLPEDRISIKGKTTEGLGFTGRGEGIAVQASALVVKKSI